MTGRKTIGFIIPNIIHPNENRVWSALMREVKAKDVNLISVVGAELNPTDTSRKSANAIYKLLKPKEVDGIIIWASIMGLNVTKDNLSTFIKNIGVPAVSVDDIIPGIPSVVGDNHGGICAIIDHMIKVHKKRKIAFIRGPENSAVAEMRFQAYKDTLSSNELEIDPTIITPPVSWMDTESIDKIIKEKSNSIDCIASVCDNKIIHAMAELQRLDIKVPEDISVVGFDNEQSGQVLNRPLTTIDPNHSHMLKYALELLLDAINGRTPQAETIVPARLIVRETCGCISSCISEAGQHSDSEINKKKYHNIERTEEEKILHEVFSQTLSKTKSDTVFIHKLEDLVEASIKSVGDDEAWHNRISDLRLNYKLHRLGHRKAKIIENLIHQARVTVSLAAARKIALLNLERDHFRNMFLEICQSLVSTYNLKEIFTKCDEGFRRLGIYSFCIMLCTDKKDPAQGLKITMISTGDKTIFNPDNTHFSTTLDLIPEEFLNLVKGFRMVAMPLYFQNNHIGIVLFGDGPDEGGVYELLCGQLSSAIMGDLLIVQLKERAGILSKGIEDLTLSLKGMIESSEAIGNNMTVQSSAIQEQAGAIEEMTRNIKQIVSMTTKSNLLSEEFNAAANKGQSSVNDSVESINIVAEHSKKITEVLTIIRQISKQTNILAMNAAIEAAHAGDSGKGFSIVADEVRNLAESADKNVLEIQSFLKQISDGIGASVTRSKDVALRLEAIMQNTEQNVVIANQLQAAMIEQESGANEMLNATHELLRITEEVNESIKAQKDAIMEFSKSLHSLKDISKT